MKDIAKKEAGFRDIVSILNDPTAKAKLTTMIDQAMNCKLAIQSKQQEIKDLRETAKTQLNLNPKLFSAYVAAAYNNDYLTRRDSHAEIVDLLDAAIALLPATNSNHQGAD